LCRGIGGAARRGLQGPLPAGGPAALTRSAAVPLLAPPAPALSAVPVLHGRNRCHKESGRVGGGGKPPPHPARLSRARVWDSATGRPAGPPLHHPVFVRYAAFSRDGRYVVPGDSAPNVRVWDGYTGDLLVPPLSTQAVGVPRRIWFSANGRQI